MQQPRLRHDAHTRRYYARTTANLVAVGCLLLLIAVETVLCLALVLSR